MRSKIQWLLVLQLLCCIGYWLLPSYLCKVSTGGEWHTENVPFNLLYHDWLGKVILFTIMAVCLFFPAYTLVAYSKNKCTLWILCVTLLKELLMWWMFWGFYLMSIEDDWEANSQLKAVPFVGLYLLPVSVALSCLLLELVWMEKQKTNQAVTS